MNLSNSKKHQILDAVAVAAKLALGIVFLYSGIQHILRPQEFLAAVSGYQLAASNLNVFAASVLPWVEALVGMGLISGFLPRGAALVAAILFAIYGTAIAVALSRHLKIDCGCLDLGNNASPVTGMTFLRTAALFTVAVGLFIQSIIRPKAIPRDEPPIQLPKVPAS